ncbi:MAG: ChaN family lipoprotein [Burkholderiaceae bacterium]|nr:ChaN family lipoprotein [Burkholderiaceae bacterium]
MLAMAGCAAPSPFDSRRFTLLPADALLLGEQHDAAEHQQLERRTVEWLASRGELAALAIEMAEQGRDTTALSSNATEDEVRAALAWPEQGWPWPAYAPVVMAAVRAGVPVLGANLPQANLGEAMRDATLDASLPPTALQRQLRQIREGHCNALPEAQLLPMTRVQIARDRAMAGTVTGARQPGRVVLLVAGNGHVQRSLGVPMYLPPEVKSKVVSALAMPAPDTAASEAVDEPNISDADLIWLTPPVPPRDYCAEVKPSPVPDPGLPH